MVSVDTSHLDVIEGDVLTVTLDRPEKLNAIDLEMAAALHEVLSKLNANPEKPLLVRGSGEGTCAGVDTDQLSPSDTGEADAELQETVHEIFDLLRLYPRPVGFAGEGAVVGGGLVLALNADFAVVADDTTLSFPEIKLGLSSRPTLHILAAQVGSRMAKEIVMTGEPMDPKRAHEVGLVNSVVPAPEVEDTARRYLEATLEYDHDIVANIKHTVDHHDSDTFWRLDPAEDRWEHAL